MKHIEIQKPEWFKGGNWREYSNEILRRGEYLDEPDDIGTVLWDSLTEGQIDKIAILFDDKISIGNIKNLLVIEK